MGSQVRRQVLRHALVDIERAVSGLATKLGKPCKVAGEYGWRMRYASPDVRHYCLLRAVRVVSGLRAMVALLEPGFAQEMGVIARTVDDFLGEIDLALEGTKSESPTPTQLRMLEEFFADEIKTFDEFRGWKKPGYVEKRKIRASQARQLAPTGDRECWQKRHEYIDHALNGYVHGGYSQVMELYAINPAGGAEEGFCMEGVAGSSHIAMWEGKIAVLTVTAYNCLAELAWVFKEPALRERLIEARKEFEASPAHPDEQSVGQ